MKEYQILIVEEIFHLLFKKKINELNYKVGDWEINDFSCVFSLSLLNEEKNKFHIKIPRVNITFSAIDLIKSDDVEMAKNEYKSLQFLQENWPDKYSIKFIEPIVYIEKYNAIVSKTFIGTDFFLNVRKYDIRNKFFNTQIPTKIQNQLKNISNTIFSYHKISITNNQIRNTEIILLKVKIKKIISELMEQSVSQDCFKILLEYISTQDDNFKNITYASTLKGLDIRNILINLDNEICMLDPGKLKIEPEVAGIARYLVTCEMIYWGTIYFFFHFKLSNKLLSTIKSPYQNIGKSNRNLLKLYLIKEYCKHWKQAYHNIDLKKRWPNIFRACMKYFYVDRFFNKEINKIIKNESE
tara:strand:+ start:142 stop:1206 length:1065 start_codon:yes stop_codon:yes gene_type:complete